METTTEQQKIPEGWYVFMSKAARAACAAREAELEAKWAEREAARSKVLALKAREEEEDWAEVAEIQAEWDEDNARHARRSAQKAARAARAAARKAAGGTL